MLLLPTTARISDNYKRLEKIGYDNFDPVSLSFTFIGTPQGNCSYFKGTDCKLTPCKLNMNTY